MKTHRRLIAVVLNVALGTCSNSAIAVGSPPVSGGTLMPFMVSASDTSLVPVLVRWAQTDGFAVVVDGRRVTTRSLREEAYLDLPLTPEARATTGATAEQAITAALKTYAAYRSDVEVSAVFKPPYFLSITTKRATPAVASVAPPQSPPSRQTASPPPATKPLPPPTTSASASTKVMPAPTWDAAARKSAGVMPATWLVGDSPSLRSVIEIWARQSGHQVEWASTHDYQITDAVKTIRYTGTFREALMQLAGSFGRLDAPLGMTFGQSGGRPVLRVFDL
ncbi:TcpQ domain-containing protein [Variovorax sp. YR216]|uniref:TcpQ domain-containing protein n=1 Tax=Variovorax sp. YR216 TaxID=1882828 RepID=UPI00089734D9|nr:TcpQ domain-containing protein [Variovorax sp. YR216]SEB26342.1 Toxin co-regulated pilus biosynthesis protein Q [Variovorax sp. YR216]